MYRICKKICLVVLLMSEMTALSSARSGGQLLLTGGDHELANIYPGREILNPLSPAYPDGQPYLEWRMYYSGWDVEVTGSSILQQEKNQWGTCRDRIYIASDWQCSAHDGSQFNKYGVVLEPSGSYTNINSPWIAPDGLHVSDVCPVIGPDNRMYLFYSGAYCPPGVEPTSYNIVNTICVARSNDDWYGPGPYIKSPDNPIIWPWGGSLDGNTFMPMVKYHDGKFKMWFLGAEELDGFQSNAPIAIWYTECTGDPMYTSNWSSPIKVFRTYWAPTNWWDRFPFYMHVKIHTNLSYQIFYTGYNYDNYWQGIKLDHRQVGINCFWSSNGINIIEDNNNGTPILQGRFHEPSSTYPDGFFMALSYVAEWGGWMYYGGYDHPYNSTKCKIYRYQIGCGGPGTNYPVGDLNQDCRVDLQDLLLMAENWLVGT